MNEQRERQLVLDYECLHSMPNGLREVRVWLDPVLETWLVGKRIDLSEVQGADLVEPRVMEMINHPNVVNVRSVATIPSYRPPMQVVEVFMPYYELGSITDALLRGERFTAAQSLRIIRAALQGLAEMHERYGILHRDVKSPNLFLTGDASTVKIGDLGLAGAMDSMGKAPCVNAPHLYAPPELLIGDGLTRSSDLYSLGVVLLELLRGRFDYDAYTTTDVVDALLVGRPPLRREDSALPAWVCKSLRKLVQKATDSDPARRFQTAREMSDQIAKIRIADWQQADGQTWEAPFLRNPKSRVRITAAPSREGGITLSTQRRKTMSWRRIGQDVTVSSLDHNDARAVFESANSLAVS
ncbi:serine/threonine-protein kinase [Streptomyces sp. EAG2]|uniref:serine/threonine-protein kinase n=1 Tax=Streptomyces sp. EAG2 TaxID=2056495 RepID=UPI000C6C994A|nr:serine/threonine-protein kinase [Streptomyces sp. EAG2]PKR46112.1 protein kinase [Streptomyces sp. EAG2]